MSKKSDTKKQTKAKPNKPPETTIQLLVMMVKGMIKGLPKMVPRMILKALLVPAITFLAIMLLNIYLVADVNEGFGNAIPPTSPVYDLLNIGSNRAGFALLSFLTVFWLRSLWSTLRTKGAGKFFGDLFAAPVWGIHCVDNSNTVFYAFFGMFAIVSITGLFNDNMYVNIVMVLILYLIFSSKDEGMTTFVSKLLYSDYQRLFRRKKEKKALNTATVGILLMAAMAGFLVQAFVPDRMKTFYSIAVVALVLAAMIAVKLKLINKKTASAFFITVLIYKIYFMITGNVLADDGGLSEAGGSWRQWFGSPGSGTIVRTGTTPGLLGVLGGLVSSAATNTWDALGGAYDTARDGLSDAYDTVSDGLSDAYDTVSEEVSYWGGVVGETIVETAKDIGGTVGHVVSRAGEELYETGSAFCEGVYDLATNEQLRDDWIRLMGEDLGEMYDQASDLAGDLYEGGSQLVDDFVTVMSDDQMREDFLNGMGEDIYNGLSTAYDTTADALEHAWNNPQDVVDGLANAAEATGDFLGNMWDKFSDTMNDPEKVYQTIKDMVGADNFANSWDPNRSGWDRVGQALWGSFEAAGAITGARSAVGGLKSYGDDFVRWRADRAFTSTIDDAAAQYGDDVARHLGRKGDYIQHSPVDPASMTRESKNVIGKIAQEEGVAIHVRPGNVESVRWLDEGRAIPKPECIKSKTINAVDELIGAPPNSRGVVGHFKPKMPDNFSSLSPADQASVLKRYDSRMAAFNKYGDDLAKLEAQGRFKVVDGRIQDMKSGKLVAGDVDLYDITMADGTKAPASLARRVEDRLVGNAGSRVEHRSLTEWSTDHPTFHRGARDGMIEAGKVGDEGVYTFANGQVTHGYGAYDIHRLPDPSSIDRARDAYAGIEGIKVTTGNAGAGN